MGSFMSGNLFYQGMMYLITLVFGGWLIAHGKMEAADLAMYALYIGIFISPIQILVELTEMMQKGLSGFRRFLDVVETEPEIVNAPDAEPLENVKGEVEYKVFVSDLKICGNARSTRLMIAAQIRSRKNTVLYGA